MSNNTFEVDKEANFAGLLEFTKFNVTNFAWNIDGTEVNDVLSVSHTFTEEGTYQVTFSARDHYGHNSSVFTKEILAVRQPTIEITNNPARYVNEGDHIFNCVADVYGTVQTYEWISSIDGTLSTQKSFVTQLSNGTHNISVRVQDNYGFWSEYDYVDVKVSGLPWISEMELIPNPAELDQFVALTADFYIDEGSVTGWTWSSSIDGELASGSVLEYYHNISITDDMDYSPSDITVVAGSTIKWTNDDSMTHTITDEDGNFDSFDISPGNTFSLTMHDLGTFTYYCKYHPSMEGTITVIESPYRFDNLSLGFHTISLVLESDTGNLSETFTRMLMVQNTPPQINVDEMSIFPSEGVFGETTYHLVGNATDFHSLTYEWQSSNVSGVLSTSIEFSIEDLPVGHHDILFAVMDEYGKASAYNFINGIWVKSRPTVVIVSDTVVPEDTNVIFSAVHDDLDGWIEDIRWFANGEELLDNQGSGWLQHSFLNLVFTIFL